MVEIEVIKDGVRNKVRAPNRVGVSLLFILSLTTIKGRLTAIIRELN